MRTIHRLVLLLPACAWLSACASRGVQCDGRLQPINPPRAAADVTPPRTP
jgi:hypothetical protein